MNDKVSIISIRDPASIGEFRGDEISDKIVSLLLLWLNPAVISILLPWAPAAAGWTWQPRASLPLPLSIHLFPSSPLPIAICPLSFPSTCSLPPLPFLYCTPSLWVGFKLLLICHFIGFGLSNTRSIRFSLSIPPPPPLSHLMFHHPIRNAVYEKLSRLGWYTGRNDLLLNNSTHLSELTARLQAKPDNSWRHHVVLCAIYDVPNDETSVDRLRANSYCRRMMLIFT